MPRKAKDEINEEKKVKKINSTKDSSGKSTSKKATSTKSSSTKSTSKKVTSAKSSSAKSTSKKVTSAKSSSTKSTSKKAASTKKSNSKGVSSKTSVKKKTASRVSLKNNSVQNIKASVLEYYDLPYRYNKTIVKLLAQTPNTLFVYWDISDEDKKRYIEQYGEFFFNDTKPVLVIHNNTKNYAFEVDINDFANSWYIHVLDSDCDYSVELGRRPINKYAKSPDFLQISSSNDIQSPNDHILFDSLNNNIYFRNLKTNITSKKDISLSFLSRIGKVYDIRNFYENMYTDEYIDFDRLDFKRLPSS